MSSDTLKDFRKLYINLNKTLLKTKVKPRRYVNALKSH